MQTITLAITGMSCGHCVAGVRSALAAVPGVEVEQVQIGAATVRVDGAHAAGATEALLAAVEDAGYEARPEAPLTLGRRAV
jgi:copper chaperone CopZ